MLKYELEILEKLDPYDHVIWDWNGTLLNDAEMVIEVNNILLRQHGLSEITLEDYRHVFCHPVREYYRKLGFDLQKTPFEQIGDQFIRLYKDRVDQVDVFAGAKEILATLQSRKKAQWILSAAHQADLLQLLPRFGVAHFFAGVYGIGDHYADGKVGRGKELLQNIEADRGRIILVGDTDHDFEVAMHLGIDILLVSQGHQSSQRLRALTGSVIGH